MMHSQFRTACAALLVAMLFCSSLCHAESRAPATERLELISSATERPTRAIIVFGGIYETYHYWDSWVSVLTAPQTSIYGFDHNHSSTSMPAGAHALAQEIGNLQTEGISDVTVIAHSMAGLVSKAAFDELVKNGTAATFARLELKAFGTPWGGFLLAEPAHLLPGSTLISQLIGLPMGPDIGPGSAFMEGLGTAWLPNMHLRLYVGTQDGMAAPRVSITRSRYAGIERMAESVTILQDVKHKDYYLSDPNALGSSSQKLSPAMLSTSKAD